MMQAVAEVGVFFSLSFQRQQLLALIEISWFFQEFSFLQCFYIHNYIIIYYFLSFLFLPFLYQFNLCIITITCQCFMWFWYPLLAATIFYYYLCTICWISRIDSVSDDHLFCSKYACIFLLGTKMLHWCLCVSVLLINFFFT